VRVRTVSANEDLSHGVKCLRFNPPNMPLAAGTKLDGYEIRGLLGAGGMGEVYRASDPALRLEQK
jgi:hypothetical protein